MSVICMCEYAHLSTFMWSIKANSGSTEHFLACTPIQIYVDFPQDSKGKNPLHPHLISACLIRMIRAEWPEQPDPH